MEEPRAHTAVMQSAFRLGGELALDIFRAWRRDLSCIDALILLAVTRSNVDGILYDRDQRARFGGVSRVAPDDLRQPVSPSIVALSLGLPEPLVASRVVELVARDECEVTPTGMLITAQQVEATHRTEIIRSAYAALRRCCLGLRAVGVFTVQPPLTPAPVAEPPARSAAAHGAKYVLRLCSTLAAQAGDVIDALLLLEILRQEAEPLTPSKGGRSLGVAPRDAKRRIRALVANQICRFDVSGNLALATGGWWFSVVAEKNLDHLFQLCAGLSEVGALAEFESGPPDE